MGEPLYEQVTGKVADGKLNRPCRIYAPVGTHETLLAYLVRRLLENGANTSFVNRIADTSLPLDELVADPVTAVEKLAQQEGQTGLPHPKIPCRAIFTVTGATTRQGWISLTNTVWPRSPLPCSIVHCKMAGLANAGTIGRGW